MRRDVRQASGSNTPMSVLPPRKSDCIREVEEDRSVRIELDLEPFHLEPTAPRPADARLWIRVAEDATLSVGATAPELGWSENLPLKFLLVSDSKRRHYRLHSPLYPVLARLRGWNPDEGAGFIITDVDRERFIAERIAHGVAARVYNAMWARVLPYLHAEALTLTRAARGDVLLYNALATSSRLRDLVRVSRAAGALARLGMDRPALRDFQRECLRDGVQLRDMLCHLVRRALFEPAVEGVAQLDFFSPDSVSAGFLAWARQARLTPAYFPFSGVRRLLRLIRRLFDMGDRLDPNLVARLGPPRHWYLFHTAAYVDEGLGLAVLRNPGAGLAATERYFPPHMTARLRRHEWITQLLYEVRDTIRTQDRSLSRYSFRRQCEASRRYHRALDRERDERQIEKARQDKRPFPEPGFTEYADEQFSLVWLPDSAALIEEGLEMGHCVSGYGELCHPGIAIIYSVRNAAGERLATLELDFDCNIQQLMGPGNSRPSRRLSGWVRRTVRMLAERPGVTEKSKENVMAYMGV